MPKNPKPCKYGVLGILYNIFIMVLYQHGLQGDASTQYTDFQSVALITQRNLQKLFCLGKVGDLALQKEMWAPGAVGGSRALSKQS